MLPVFSFVLSGRHHAEYGYITADGRQYHLVGDFDEFYAALGYSPELSRAGVEAEYYVWDTFVRDQASKSLECLQTQITAYLNRVSKQFRADYGAAYDQWLDECNAADLDHSVLCAQCPRQSAKSQRA